MRLLVGLLPAAACFGGMLLCMRMMRGGHAGAQTTDVRGGQPTAPDAASEHEVAELRDEVNRLRAELRSSEEEPPRAVSP